MASEPIPYSERPEWSDVEPIPQRDDGQVLVPILYNADYKEAMGYFRAIIQAGEYSDRVLQLTEHIIRLNPAHYSVWQYRYRTLLQINAPLDQELTLINTMMAQNLKTYQIWHHRRLLQTHLRAPMEELAFIEKSLTPRPVESESEEEDDDDEQLPDKGVCDNTKAETGPTGKHTAPHSAKASLPPLPKPKPAPQPPSQKPVDTKNYHTWAYRQWLLAEFNAPELWAGELDFVEAMLRHDVRNNSAWHHRFFVVFESGVREGEEDREDVVRREIDYVKERIALAPNNPSAWNYLRGILQRTGTPFATLEPFVVPYTIPHPTVPSSLKGKEFVPTFLSDAPSKAANTDLLSDSAMGVTAETSATETIDLENPLPSKTAELPCALAIEFLADVYLEKASSGTEGKEVLITKANELFEALAKEHDTIRRKYWEYRQARASKQLNA